MSSSLHNIISRGYFPKELPSAFFTSTFGDFAITPASVVLEFDKRKASIKNNIISLPCTHNLARSGSLRRIISIPNPINQFQISKTIIENWKTLKSLCHSSTISLTKPIYSRTGVRAINPKYGFSAIPTARAHSRVASKYILNADLSQFYPSIYTHSIPWALHTKPVSKSKRTDLTLIGNLLDTLVRNGQDTQTIGIPIGPDTSLVIAEALLSSIDNQLTGTIRDRGYRYIDDIGCGFKTISEAEETLAQLQYLYGEYQLELNPKKTSITDLPSYMEALWAPDLRLFTFRGASPVTQHTDLLSFFGKAFELASLNREEAILRYAIQRMRSIVIHEKNWPLYESLLLQCLSVEPGTAPSVVSELYKYSSTRQLDRNKISHSFQQLILDSSPMRHGSEAVWAIWGAICLQCKLSPESIEKSFIIDDSCVALTALHAIQAKIVSGPVDTTVLETLMHEDELYQNHWLLAYEANIKGWLPNLGGTDFVAANKHFGPMKTFGVSFYNIAATPGRLITLTPLVSPSIPSNIPPTIPASLAISPTTESTESSDNEESYYY